jgi:hypothetical protein
MEEKIFALHPDKDKMGVRISKAKYDVVRDAIIETLRFHGELTFTELFESVNEKLYGNFDGSISWYTTTIKLDLEARKVIVRVPKTSPQRLRLTKM